MCPRVTGYNKMSRKLSVEHAELISECHLSTYLAAKMDMFLEKKSFYLLDKIVSFYTSATSRHLPDVGNSLLRCI